MTFPYPEKLEDWQSAYTREQAHRDSQSRAVLFFVPLMLFFLVGFLYAYIKLVRIKNAIPSDILYAVVVLGVVLGVIFIFIIGIRSGGISAQATYLALGVSAGWLVLSVVYFVVTSFRNGKAILPTTATVITAED